MNRQKPEVVDEEYDSGSDPGHQYPPPSSDEDDEDEDDDNDEEEDDADAEASSGEESDHLPAPSTAGSRRALPRSHSAGTRSGLAPGSVQSAQTAFPSKSSLKPFYQRNNPNQIPGNAGSSAQPWGSRPSVPRAPRSAPGLGSEFTYGTAVRPAPTGFVPREATSSGPESGNERRVSRTTLTQDKPLSYDQVQKAWEDNVPPMSSDSAREARPTAASKRPKPVQRRNTPPK